MKSNLTRRFPHSPFPFCWRRSGKLALAGFLIFLWGLSSLLAVNSSFHKWLHHDANQNNHQCVVRLLENQQILHSGPAITPVVFDPGGNCEIGSCYFFVAASTDVRLCDGRAPPGGCLPSVS